MREEEEGGGRREDLQGYVKLLYRLSIMILIAQSIHATVKTKLGIYYSNCGQCQAIYECLVVWALAIRFPRDDYIYYESLCIFIFIPTWNDKLEYGSRSLEMVVVLNPSKVP